MNKKILGLDLGTNSIGWAVVTLQKNPAEVRGTKKSTAYSLVV